MKRAVAALLPIVLGLGLLGGYLAVFRPHEASERDWVAKLQTASDGDRAEYVRHLALSPRLSLRVAERLLDGPPDARAVAVDLLVRTGDPPSLRRLIGLLEDSQLQSAAARRLAQANVREAIPAMLAAFDRSPPGTPYRLGAFRSLRYMSADRELLVLSRKLLSDPESTRLVADNDDSTPANVERTLRLLAIVLCHPHERDPARWDGEAMRAFRSPSPAVKAAALHALSRIQHPDALKAVEEGLNDQSFIIKPSAVEALQHLTPPTLYGEIHRIDALPEGQRDRALKDLTRRLKTLGGILRP